METKNEHSTGGIMLDSMIDSIHRLGYIAIDSSKIVLDRVTPWEAVAAVALVVATTLITLLVKGKR